MEGMRRDLDLAKSKAEAAEDLTEIERVTAERSSIDNALKALEEAATTLKSDLSSVELLLIKKETVKQHLRQVRDALEQVKTDVPLVVRLVGTNAEEGRALLADADMITAESLAEAAEKAVMAAQGAS